LPSTNPHFELLLRTKRNYVVYNSDMQLAKSYPAGTPLKGRVRRAEQADAAAIHRLMQTGDQVHTHIDWRPPGDWLGTPGFVVFDRADGSPPRPRLFGNDPDTIVAALAVAADPPPAAWVRLAAFRAEDPDQAAALFAAVLTGLDPAVKEINWFADEDWSPVLLAYLGFAPVAGVIGYSKADLATADYHAPSGLVIRPATAADMPALAAIEERAFEPRWRHSVEGLFAAWQRAMSFDVALVDDRPAGFQMSHGGPDMAHLSRMTVDPPFQGRSIGAALLAHAIEGYQARGMKAVTLNTQVDNVASQRLYTRFGFRREGDEYVVWGLTRE
jgi:ribosomal protein S18 acetylase RimI-like enzyme